MQNKWNALLLCSLFLFAGCRPHENLKERNDVDTYNERAYRFRYVNVDSTKYYARKALSLARNYDEGQAEARLNLAFVAYQQMDFGGVDSLLSRICECTQNPLSLLCADVMHMKVYQRTGDGEHFFQAKSQAEDYIKALSRRESSLSPHEIALWVYAQTEFYIISSTYYCYQEQDAEARAELDKVPACLQTHVDTVQWVYYNYMLGPGGLVEGSDVNEILLQEFDYLFRAYSTSRRNGLPYFEANCLQAFATLFFNGDSLVARERADAYNLLRFQHTEDTTALDNLPLTFARRALILFKDYDDLFQTACAYRTLGEVHFQQGRYEQALENYEQALHCVNQHHLRYYRTLSPDTLSVFNPNDLDRSIEMEWIDNPRISTVPEWIAGIRQQLSLTFSAMNMKQASDYNRNSYLDLLQATSQNAELENRTARLERQTQSLRLRMWLCAALLVAALLMALLLRRRQRHSVTSVPGSHRRNPLALWLDGQRSLLEDRQEELQEQVQVSLSRTKAEKRRNVENRAKVSLVHAIVPFLDRIGGEVMRMKREGYVKPERRAYIIELVDQIERYNVLLTDWIKMEQGQLRLHITTFPLAQLFRIIGEGHYPFDQKGITLHVEHTDALVKADESLTLFMINTLTDNARKFTPSGGCVTLSVEETTEYAEVRVTDTGCGLSEEDVETLMTSKVYDASEIGSDKSNKGFGFGLMNCRGIIEKYKKTSDLFSCCAFGVRSQLGKGSTFYFRLPRVVRLLLLFLLSPVMLHAGLETELYDSVYQSNLDGRYEDALNYAHGTLEAMNLSHPSQPPLQLNDTTNGWRESVDLLWAQNGVPVDYELLVGLRNEVALAALVLHDWPLYRYNNRICIRLHKYINQDRELPDYYRRLQRTHRNNNILLMLIVAALVVLLFISYRLIVSVRKRLQQINEMLASEHGRLEYEQNRLHIQNQVLDNCLSTIKHESMYYPSRIRQLVDRMGDDDIGQLSELVQYYHHIYTLLCRQADAQVNQPGFKRQRIRVAELLGYIGATCDDSIKPDTTVVGDVSLVCMLVETLRTGMKHEGAQIGISAKLDEDFVRFTLRDTSVCLSEDELSILFFPESGHISYLIAKQILREHDTYTNHPGCRLVAQPSEGGGYEIYFTLVISEPLTPFRKTPLGGNSQLVARPEGTLSPSEATEIIRPGGTLSSSEATERTRNS